MNGKIIKGDNIKIMKKIPDNYIDSCISDFPYGLEFMGKNWDSFKNWNNGEGKHSTWEGAGYTGQKRPAFYTTTNKDKLIFYEWCYDRAIELYRIMKPGGYILIFGHPKTNHRMKSAFEDAGFNIVEEIDWIYLTGMPKSQDIGKLFDKKAGKKREVIGIDQSKLRPNRKSESDGADRVLAGGFKSDNGATITAPVTKLAKQWDGWKTSGLKPAHEPITVFQKPLEGIYCNNIEKWNCGGMNIDACRVPYDGKEDKRTHGGNWSTKKAAQNVYAGGYAGERLGVSEKGKFPPNVLLDEYTYKLIKNEIDNKSNIFPIFKYCTKVSPKEKLLLDGTKNHHVTVKPKKLIKWLIKLVTPKNGITIDITAGSCTHAVACEELNRDEGYNLKWCNIEIDEDDKGNILGYIDFGKKRLQEVILQNT